MRHWIIPIVILTLFTQSCEKDNPDKETYIAYNLNGVSCSGAFRIETDGNQSGLEATAFLTPETQEEPEVLFLTFQDNSDMRSVVFIIPIGTGNPFVLVHDSDFGMAISNPADGCALVSGVENTLNGVSIDIQEFRRGQGALGFASVDYLEVYFVGIMSFENDMNEIEQHTVEGNFVYNVNDVF